MTPQSRKHRGYATQRIVADAAQDTFPGCYPPGAGESGDDLRNTPGWSFEVKARRAFNPLEWMRQVKKNAAWNDVAVVMRPDGAGPTTVDDWPAFVPYGQLRRMIRDIQAYRKLVDEMNPEDK